MHVRDWMTQKVETVHPGDDVASVRARFRRHRVRQFPVVAVGPVLGLVTERDVRDAEADEPVKRFMRPPVTTRPAAAIEEAAALVDEHRVTALPVVEGDTLVGIISESDLLRALVELCRIVEPTTLIELECDDSTEVATRIRPALERRGGSVSWVSVTPSAGGRQHVALRVRMPIGHAPESILEESGYVVRSVITGRLADSRAQSSDAPSATHASPSSHSSARGEGD